MTTRSKRLARNIARFVVEVATHLAVHAALAHLPVGLAPDLVEVTIQCLLAHIVGEAVVP